MGDGTRGGYARLGRVGEFLGFATAGMVAYGVDLGLFVWLRGPMGLGPLTAKALGFVAGCAVAYLGNALGTYRRRRAALGRARRYGVFFAVSFAGALVQLGCLGFSHYVLGFTAPLDDIVSGAGIGMVLATALRFWGTRTLVFRTAGSGRPAGRGSGVASSGVPGVPPGAPPGVPGASEVPPGAPPRVPPGVSETGEGSRPTWTG